jgi:hypothetical protein
MKNIELPETPFLYTLDQIATLVNLELKTLRLTRIHFDGRSVGGRKLKTMLAHNIAAPDETPDWRVSEVELVRWLRYCGFRPVQRGWQ